AQARRLWSTATPTAPICSNGTCRSPSQPRGAAGSSRDTCSIRDRLPRCAPSSRANATDGNAASTSAQKTAAALVVAGIAFALYHATLLPSFDFGDTGSFQTTVGSAVIRPRDGYPLYFAIGDLFLRITGAEPARALNLASAVEGAAACGLF